MQLYTEEEFKQAKSRDPLFFQCENCQKQFSRKKHYIQGNLKKGFVSKYCSSLCRNIGMQDSRIVHCGFCKKELIKLPSAIKNSKSGKVFCSRSCAVTYNNRHKKYGTRVSKLELFLQWKLLESYPDLEFHFNQKDAINSELDIYIPSLKLAFELNGIFHYEPIFGDDKLSQIQNNDERKFQACLEQGIEFCTIDTSSLKYFKESRALKYFDIIKNIIHEKNQYACSLDRTRFFPSSGERVH